MAKLNLDIEETLTVTLKGAEFQLSMPTVKQIKDVQKKLDDKQDETSSMVEFLLSLGWPKDKDPSELSIRQFRNLIDYIMEYSSKKN